MNKDGSQSQAKKSRHLKAISAPGKVRFEEAEEGKQSLWEARGHTEKMGQAGGYDRPEPGQRWGVGLLAGKSVGSQKRETHGGHTGDTEPQEQDFGPHSVATSTGAGGRTWPPG